MKKLALLSALLSFTVTAFAGSNGGYGGAFARVGVGARAKAMGNAYTAVAQGPAAIYFNPGAIPSHKHKEFTAALNSMALDRRVDYLAFSAPVHPKPKSDQPPLNAGVGLAWLHAAVGDIDSRDFDGNPLEMMDMSSNLFMFSFAIQFHEKFGAGLTGKMIYETFGKIGNENRSINGDGVGVDFGAFVRATDNLTFGGQVKDIGAKTTWNTTDYWSQGSSKADKWPLQYRFGAAYARDAITAAADLEASDQSEIRPHVGAEYALALNDKYSFAGRAGFDNGAFTAGIGVGFAWWKVQSSLDFTYVFENIAPDDAVLVGWNVVF